MINIIWAILIIIGIIYGAISGNIASINNEIFTSGKTALNMILEIVPVLVVWMGLMKIAEDSNLLTKISKIISKPLRFLFPSIPNGHKSLGLIASNIAINMLGLGSAATPFGLKAMESLQELNEKKDTATDAMITFLVINTSGVTLIPTTIISLRILHHSQNPYIIIPSAILATTFATISGLIFDYCYRRRKK